MKSPVLITYGIPKPETAEEHKDLDTIDGMRRAINKARYDSALIRSVLISAEARGLSGEDKFVMLAYHALRELEDQSQRNLRLIDLMPKPSTFIRDDGAL